MYVCVCGIGTHQDDIKFSCIRLFLPVGESYDL